MNLLTQDYRGDVTILPVPSPWKALKTFKNPTESELEQMKIESERRAYPKISMIENFLKIERALEKHYEELKHQLKTRKYTSKKKVGCDEENYDSEIRTRQITDFERNNFNRFNTSNLTDIEDSDSIEEDENLEEISEKHNSLEFLFDSNRNITK